MRKGNTILEKSLSLQSFFDIVSQKGLCLRSLMDRISDSGSDGCGSIPHGGTRFLHPASSSAMSGILWASEKILSSSLQLQISFILLQPHLSGIFRSNILELC